MIVARMKKYGGVVAVHLHVVDVITGSGNRLAG